MKRRDWKIKKLKKNTFDNILKKRRIFFLRKLFLRKNLVLIKKNSIQQYPFYNFFSTQVSFLKKNITRKTYLKSNFNESNVLPVFFFRKKIFNQFFKFKRMIKNSHYFFYNSYFKKPKIGSNLIILDEKNLVIDEENKNLIEFKKFVEIKFLFSLNFYFNYNLFTLINIEIYKIIILLYLLNIKI